jgi:hypothetical protein
VSVESFWLREIEGRGSARSIRGHDLNGRDEYAGVKIDSEIADWVDDTVGWWLSKDALV